LGLRAGRSAIDVEVHDEDGREHLEMTRMPKVACFRGRSVGKETIFIGRYRDRNAKIAAISSIIARMSEHQDEHCSGQVVGEDQKPNDDSVADDRVSMPGG